MQTLIMVPLQEEIALFRHACTAHGLAPADLTVGQLVAMRVPDLGLTVVPGGLGKVQFAIQTQHVLDVSRTWDVVIWAGAAGALVDGLAVGDVVVATVDTDEIKLSVGNTPSMSAAKRHPASSRLTQIRSIKSSRIARQSWS
jgi:nucleoside phosphorylase